MSFFKNRVVVITGASSGIGRQLALDLSAMGAVLILISRSYKKLRELQLYIKEKYKNSNTEIISLDVGKEEEVNILKDLGKKLKVI